MRVLLVEDDVMVRATLCEFLAESGHTVLEAACGEDALLMAIGGQEIDLLITDHDLGGALDGKAVARWIQTIFPDTPTIFITGHAEHFNNHQFQACEIMIAKPFANDILSNAIQAIATEKTYTQTILAMGKVNLRQTTVVVDIHH